MGLVLVCAVGSIAVLVGYVALRPSNDAEAIRVIQAAGGDVYGRTVFGGEVHLERSCWPECSLRVVAVDCGGEDVGGHIIDAIVSLRTVERVDLQKSSAGDEDLVALAELPALRELDVLGARVSLAGLQRFVRQRPEVRIVADLPWLEELDRGGPHGRD